MFGTSGKSASAFVFSGLLFLRLVPFGTPVATPSQDDKQPCCFTNSDYQGTCTVQPGEGETCESILTYLNSDGTVGKNYCFTSRIRGGWQKVDCPQDGQRGQIPGRK